MENDDTGQGKRGFQTGTGPRGLHFEVNNVGEARPAILEIHTRARRLNDIVPYLTSFSQESRKDAATTRQYNSDIELMTRGQ